MSLDQLLCDAAPGHETVRRRAAELRPAVLAQFIDDPGPEPRPRRALRRISRATVAGTAAD